jgi:hypothetical protein
LRQPNAAASTVISDYVDPGNVTGTVATSLNLGGVRAGSGWIAIGTRMYYTKLAVKLRFDAGYFGPDDDPAWVPKSIVWSPAPGQTKGVHAFYDVTFDANGLCWLNSDPGTVVDPNVGFPVTVSDRSAVQCARTAGTDQRPLPTVHLDGPGPQDPEMGVARADRDPRGDLGRRGRRDAGPARRRRAQDRRRRDRRAHRGSMTTSDIVEVRPIARPQPNRTPYGVVLDKVNVTVLL